MSSDPQDRFEVLHYSGDVTATALPGTVLGGDEFGRPFEVLDAELETVLADGHTDGDGCVISVFSDSLQEIVMPGHRRQRTTVHLQYATPETLRTAVAALMEQRA